MPRRTIFVLSTEFGGKDGVSELSRQAVRALAGPQHTLVVHSLLDARRPAAFDGLDVQFTGASGSAWRFAGQTLPALLRATPGDLVLVLHVHLLPLVYPALWRRVPLAAVLIGIEAWRSLPWLQRSALARAARVLAISQYTADRFLAVNRNVVSGPVTVCHLAAPPAEPAGVSGVSPGYTLMVGRMSATERYKGHDSVLDAWAAVRAAHPAARLVVAGDGTDRRRLEQKAEALGLGGAATFVGRVDAARLAALYRDAGFFVMPSRNEGFGLVYLEAMRAGLPCIASPGSANEIFGETGSALFVPPGDAAALAAACIRLFTEPGLGERMGAAGAARVAGAFAFPVFAARFREALGIEENRATC